MEKLSPAYTTMVLYFVAIILHIGGSDAQILSNLVSSSPTQQATNASVVVTVTATPPAILASRFWVVKWHFDGVLVGLTSYHSTSGNTFPAIVNTTTFLRGDISASMPTGSNNQFTTSFTLHELQVSDDGKIISVSSDGDGVGIPPPSPQQFTLNVANCPSNISSDITVEASSYLYNAQGTFKCSNNGELFYSDGARPSSSDATCLASATWSGQDSLQCWSAPNVSLGDFTVVEGHNLTITCDYIDTTPSGNLSVFYVGDAVHTRPKNAVLVLQSLQRSDNNKLVSCQAVTPYTQIPANNNTGRSTNYTINVQFASYRQEGPQSCKWNLNEINQFCKVKFLSNPPAEFVSLTLNGVSVTNDGSNKMKSFEYNQTFCFNRTNVTIHDSGSYTLKLNSPAFSSSEIVFDIIVGDSNSPGTGSNGLIIGVSCAAAVIVILVFCFIVWKRRKQKNKGEKEERINPIYVASPDPVVQVGAVPGILEYKNFLLQSILVETTVIKHLQSTDDMEVNLHGSSNDQRASDH